MTQSLPFQLDSPSLFKDQSYVDGAWVESASGRRFHVTDPGTGQNWASVPENDASDVEPAVQAAQDAFLLYRKTTPRQRSQYLLNWHLLRKEHKSDIAKIITYETGKPLNEAAGELDYAISSTWWFAGEADRIQGTFFDSSMPGKKVLTIKQPIGVVAALVPWNFPVAMVVRKAAAALAAGCTMIVKPSPETPLSILSLAQLAAQAGFPNGCLNVLTTSLAYTPALSEALCRHALVKKVTFTGSTRIGKLIAKICSDSLTKVTLELGGNCPFVIFDDADLDQAAAALMNLKWRNSGQACISANRVYVQGGVYEKFASMITDLTSKLVVGHGSSSDSTLGPVTTPQSLDRISEQVKDAQLHGALILLGGKRVENTTGYFFQPTIIADATSEMRVTHEESFAPILTFYKFQSESEAIKLANDTPMGLASYVFTKDLDRAWRLLDEIEAGMIGLNTSAITGAESPFGGMKESGYGKEAGKDVAVEEYLVTKAASVAIASRL
ncbi:unnamed protein product [Clonostachys rhizophaga]|uniref:Aldehyde dehydrogenase domain-containing protein n=1 Tax=Clonostachys rhizophaga TaxID=160324 RepID=A0A9N9VN11_9HYPO|nr:unnamed protein product [Clonostachys rhizophaga]